MCSNTFMQRPTTVTTYLVFPNKLKMALDSRSCKLEIFTRPKKFTRQQVVNFLFLACETKKRPKNKADKKISGL